MIADEISISAAKDSEPVAGQPSFHVYSALTDEMVPLTQERLTELLAFEKAYASLICEMRNGHKRFMTSIGRVALPWDRD